MKVLTISGDRRFRPGNHRYDLQASVVDLTVLYWGRGALFPRIPEDHFDVVTVQDPFFRGLFGLYVSKKLGTRFNVQIHTDLSAQSFFKNFIARIVLRHADSVRVVSQKIKDTVENFHVRASIVVLPVYIDVSRYRTIPRASDGRTILWVGRFEPEKNPFFALEILRVARKKSIDARLVMLGAGSLADGLRQSAAHLPVEFPGWQDPIVYLATAALVVSTSLHESWGASIVEALAAGVPVVAPDIGVAREAGAIVVSHEHMPGVVAEVLTHPKGGQLLLHLLNKEEWSRAWYDSLI